MKNLFRILMAAAVLLTASCAKEDISSTIGGGEVEVTFTANLADMGTRAYGDGTQANVVYLGVYEAGSTTPLSSLVKPEGYGVNADGTASITVVLLKDKVYDLVFWAQNKDVNCYTRNWEGRNIEVSYVGVESQAEARDAFFLVRENYKAGAADAETIFKLRRPFAQLNVGLSAEDVGYIKKNGFADYEDNKIFKTSEVTINKVNTVLSLDLNEDGDPAAVSTPTTNVTFAAAAVPTTTLEVNGVEYTHLSMNYLLVNEELIEVDYKFVDAKNTSYERTYYQVPVKRNYRTNILGQLISSPLDFTVIIKPEFTDPDENLDAQTQIFKVSTAEELAAALTTKVEKHIKNLEIILLNDIDLPISSLGQQTGGSGEYKVGNVGTDNITLNLNGKKLNITTTYWSALGAKNNNALFTIKNGTMTSTGNSAGTWNAWDLRFSNCDYVFESVAFEKAVALDNAGKSVKMTDVTITDTHNTDTYGLWITAEGQTVTLENCVIDMLPASDGRGIKIDEQYVGAEEKALVNLSVAGTTFNTKNKAAVVVKSSKGADIVWGEGNDISKVAADKVNAVWVDEDAADYYDLVEVTGCTKMLEGALDSIIEDLKSGEDVTLTSNVTGSASDGGYSKAGIVLNGQTVDGGGHTLTVNGANSTWDCAVYHGGGTLKNITVAGAFRGVFTAGSSSDIILDNVIFKDVVYTFNSDGGNKEYGVYISNSTLNGWTSHSDVHKEVVYTNCSFGEGSGYAYCCPYGPTKFVGCEFAEGYTLDANQTDKISLENCTLNGVALTAENFAQLAFGSATVDGVAVKVISDGVVLVDDAYYLSNKAGLNWFANEVNVKNNAFTGKTVKLTADIDLQNAAWTPVGQTGVATFNGVFDGQNYTISNLNVDSSAQTGAHYSSGLFGWVESHTAGQGHIKNVKISGATITGHHNCGALVGCITQETALVENCHVTGATISCTNANSEANGDKAGALIGNATVATPVKDCTAANSTVSAGRDAGQVIGAGREANVTRCSASNVTVSANGTGTGANIRNEVIGRLLTE